MELPALSSLRVFEAGSAHCERTDDGWRLGIPTVDGSSYAGGQIDDYGRGLSLTFAHKPPAGLRIDARFSHRAMVGTSGFGFWNHPFGPLGEVMAPPRSVWFFNASDASSLHTRPGAAGAGFKAASLNSAPWLPALPAWMWRAAGAATALALRLPLVPRLAMRASQAASGASECVLDLAELDLTRWHTYEIAWRAEEATFLIDGSVCHVAQHPPGSALGFVCWVDNYFAVAANGKYEFGHLACDHAQWLEVRHLSLDGSGAAA